MTPEQKKRSQYRPPLGTWIGRGKNTERLYALEERRDAAIVKAAEELQKVLGLEHYWHETLPEALLSILEGYDRRAAYLAAKAYIAKHPELAEE